MSLGPEQLDRPEVLAEVAALCEAYERALMANDVAALNAYFWHDARVTRYGIGDRQCGIEELIAFRAATAAPDFTRRLEHPRLVAFGPDVAVSQLEFVRSDAPGRRGFQSQTWVRLSGAGWRIVAAHVSMVAWPPTA